MFICSYLKFVFYFINISVDINYLLLLLILLILLLLQSIQKLVPILMNEDSLNLKWFCPTCYHVVLPISQHDLIQMRFQKRQPSSCIAIILFSLKLIMHIRFIILASNKTQKSNSYRYIYQSIPNLSKSKHFLL